ncbi:CUE domain-containing protein 2-like [Dysidea avara]|uniref:CUE domain-containing protein 2-like n=1 Tax=Dysidea avara TaxID=196820 RepID=UPI0033198A87
MSSRRVREELEQFLTTHVPDYDLSELDDVIVEFVAGMMCSDDSDTSELTEMLIAYIPRVGEIDSVILNEWAVQLSDKLHDEGKANSKDTGDVMGGLDELTAVVESKENVSSDSNTPPEQSDKVKELHEMFPKASADHIAKCLRQANGHMDTTVELLLTCCQDKTSSTVTEDMGQIKSHILSRNSFVDTNADKTVHKPHLPQPVEGDKGTSKLRYRDNQVVNTKGERYTIITKKDQEGEHMQQTYIHLKPARKYRFH